MAEKLGPCMQCVKCILFAFNFIFWVTGLGLLGVGIWARIQLWDYMQLSSHDYETACYVLIASGVLISIVTFLGCCGAVKENTCMLKAFAVILAVLFILELGGAITGYVFRGEANDGFKTGLDKALDDYQEKGFKKAWDDVQSHLKCCGSQNYTEWFTRRWSDTENWNTSVPKSCCKDQTVDNCNINVTSHLDKIYSDQGCYKAGIAFLEDKLLIIGGTALGVAVFQLAGIALACCLASAIQHSTKYELV